MSVNTIFISKFSDSRFQTAFQTYFAELGIQVKDWDGLFQEMDQDENNYAFLMLDDRGQTVGFLQFQLTSFANWFFEEPFGFIREFWVAPNFRKSGCGSTLLRKTEQYFAEQGAKRVLLTSDDAIDFYLARGYEKAPGITAKNKMDVLVKALR